MTQRHRNMMKITICIVAVAVLNGILTDYLTISTPLKVLWAILSGGLVGFFAALRWGISE